MPGRFVSCPRAYRLEVEDCTTEVLLHAACCKTDLNLRQCSLEQFLIIANVQGVSLDLTIVPHPDSSERNPVSSTILPGRTRNKSRAVSPDGSSANKLALLVDTDPII